MVCHVWAQQNQTEGRNSGSSIFFEGDTIYSYGRHFPMAKFVTNDKGETRVLVTNQSYSNTTSGHMADVWKAIDYDNTALTVNNPDGISHNENIKHFKDEVLALAKKLLKARKNKTYYASQIESIVNTANEYSSFFGLDDRLIVPNPKKMEALQASMKEQAKLDRATKIEEANQRVRDNRELVSDWMNGNNGYKTPYCDTVLLRVKNNEVQSSKNATMPVKFAKAIWQMVCQCKTNNTTFTPNGKTLHAGNFQVDSIHANGDLKAGCHFIKYGMLKSVARTLELI